MTFNATTPLDDSCQKKTETSMKRDKDNITKVAAARQEFEKKLPEGSFWFRKWDFEDLASISWFAGIHVLAACAPFVYDSGAFRLALVLGFMTGFALSAGYHRLLCHRSYKVPKWLEYFLAYCGAHTFQVSVQAYVYNI